MTAYRLWMELPLPIDVEPDPPAFDRVAVAGEYRGLGAPHSLVVTLVERDAERARAQHAVPLLLTRAPTHVREHLTRLADTDVALPLDQTGEPQ